MATIDQETKTQIQIKQSNWRGQLYKNFDSTPPGSDCQIWCPIFQYYFVKGCVACCVQFFPLEHAENAFQSIFGTEAGTVFNPANGLPMHPRLKDRFDRCLMTIVPNIDDLDDEAAVQQWIESRPREYKIHVCRPEVPKMLLKYNDKDTFASLHGRVLKFKSKFRPDSRFIAFQFMRCVLSLSYTYKKQGAQLAELIGTKIWVTMENYLQESELQTIAEHMGLHLEDEIFVRPPNLDGEWDDCEIDESDDESDADSMRVAPPSEVDITDAVGEDWELTEASEKLSPASSTTGAALLRLQEDLRALHHSQGRQLLTANGINCSKFSPDVIEALGAQKPSLQQNVMETYKRLQASCKELQQSRGRELLADNGIDASNASQELIEEFGDQTPSIQDVVIQMYKRNLAALNKVQPDTADRQS